MLLRVSLREKGGCGACSARIAVRGTGDDPPSNLQEMCLIAFIALLVHILERKFNAFETLIEVLDADMKLIF